MARGRSGRPAALAVAACLLGAGAEAQAVKGKAPADEARKFVEEAEARLMRLTEESSRADWVKSTHITDDTEVLAALANERLLGANMELAKGATRFDGVAVPEDVARRLRLLKIAITLPAPNDARKREELARLLAGMEGAYGKGKYCRPGKEGQQECLDINEISRIMAESRDPKELLEMWRGWHAVSPPYRGQYTRFVALANEGAGDLGFPDTGALWRSKYDMPPEAFSQEVDRLWGQVRPLYLSLHAYVRRRLRETYGPQVVPEKGPIPAHLLGNIWAQQWGNVYPLVAPREAGGAVDLTARLKAKNVDAKEMVRMGERFFLSLGFPPLPATFWERSMFTKPRDREVVCHASAWDIDNVDDLRIKMCIETNAEDFVTIHHELGHNFYQRAYNRQPFLFRDGAHDGFHEAIGDAIALSLTPSYLKQIGLIEQEPDPRQDVGLLLQMALDRIAFLPFGLLVDQWRWKVFSGEITPQNYNAEWWKLREKYQGVSAPLPRSEADFDPGAKYHVPANTPYTRYFLAHILQFQFHRALCEAAGQTGPLNRCSVYGSQAAGQRFQKMLEMGTSRPWPDELEAGTGKREMDATAILDYFAPLQKWLDEQNAGHPVGW